MVRLSFFGQRRSFLDSRCGWAQSIGAAIWALRPVCKVWIHDEGLAMSCFSMMRIMARRMRAATVLASKKTEPGKVRRSSALVRPRIRRRRRASNDLDGPGSQPAHPVIKIPHNLIVIQTTGILPLLSLACKLIVSLQAHRQPASSSSPIRQACR